MNIFCILECTCLDSKFDINHEMQTCSKHNLTCSYLILNAIYVHSKCRTLPYDCCLCDVRRTAGPKAYVHVQKSTWQRTIALLHVYKLLSAEFVLVVNSNHTGGNDSVIMVSCRLLLLTTHSSSGSQTPF